MNESTNTISDFTTFYLPFHPSPPDRRCAQGADLLEGVLTTLKFSNKTSNTARGLTSLPNAARVPKSLDNPNLEQ